ncbi:diguanylate cyclase [uncultured Thiodictyon sp.]|uniref:diguanylate cyclase n=1 Tax=uncultured Thiodictyon sp. TaxID=1846217 RepID=UPI0025E72532|nr:diguanylate cyclase [uncultured Thiodictyon sp.]
MNEPIREGRAVNPLPPILIVDDDPSNIKVLSRILKGMGEIYCASSGAKALEIASKQPIALVLLDIIMPEMDGFTTCRALLQVDPDMTVIFMTAANDPAIEIQALAVGGRDFIGKPMNSPVVRARVALHLKLKAQDAERRRAEEQLRISEERLRLLADNLVDNIWTMDPEHRLTYINPSIEYLAGFTVDEYLRLSLGQQVAPGSVATAAAYFNYLDDCIATGVPAEPFRGEMELLCKDGSTIWTEITARPLLGSDGRLIELAGVTRDIRQRKFIEIELNRHAATDVLTGAWNRRYFEQTVADEMKRVARRGEPLSLVLLDIDHFKSINDRFGHLSGDQVLVQLCQLVRAHLRAADVFARWGGEEFVILLPHCQAADAGRLAEQLRALIADHPFSAVGTVTCSFGVAQRRPAETRDAWLKRADDALYAAKAGGRNRVCSDAAVGG